MKEFNENAFENIQLISSKKISEWITFDKKNKEKKILSFISNSYISQINQMETYNPFFFKISDFFQRRNSIYNENLGYYFIYDKFAYPLIKFEEEHSNELKILHLLFYLLYFLLGFHAFNVSFDFLKPSRIYYKF